jgi:uncharacterized membrane protein
MTKPRETPANDSSVNLEPKVPKRRPVGIGPGWQLFDLAWFVWIPMVFAILGLIVGLFLFDLTYIVLAPIIAFSAFLMWHVIRAANDSDSS